MLRFRWLVSATLIALVAIAVACSGSSSTSGIPPITGIVIRGETLTTGRGCGRDPAQLFKYVAVVYGYGGSGDMMQEPWRFLREIPKDLLDEWNLRPFNPHG